MAKCDLLRSRLIVDCAVSDVNGKVFVGTTKSGKRREGPISRFIRDELASHVAGRKPDDLVFPAPRGGYLRNANVRRDCFDRAARDASLTGLVPHSLRHRGVPRDRLWGKHQGRAVHAGARLGDRDMGSVRPLVR